LEQGLTIVAYTDLEPLGSKGLPHLASSWGHRCRACCTAFFVGIIDFFLRRKEYCIISKFLLETYSWLKGILLQTGI
jgi:hypothetical protein